MVLSRSVIGTILLQLVEQEAGQGLKEDKSPEVVRGPSPLKDFFFLTIMTLRSSQVTIIISTPAPGYMFKILSDNNSYNFHIYY